MSSDRSISAVAIPIAACITREEISVSGGKEHGPVPARADLAWIGHTVSAMAADNRYRADIPGSRARSKAARLELGARQADSESLKLTGTFRLLP